MGHKRRVTNLYQQLREDFEGIRTHVGNVLQANHETVLREITGLPSYNIAFYGVGNLAGSALSSICDTLSKDPNSFGLPIENIYLLGRNGKEDDKSRAKRQRIANGADNRLKNSRSRTKVIPVLDDDWGPLLEKINLFFITANRCPSLESRREVMAEKNKIIIEDTLAQYFQKDKYEFNGIINIASNHPEALAISAAKCFNLNDVRQITANPPIDYNRYYSQVIEILEGKGISRSNIVDMDLNLIGFHGNVWPVYENNFATYIIGKKGNTKTKEISHLLKTGRDQKDMADSINSEGKKQYDLFYKEINDFKREFPDEPVAYTSGLTVGETGRALVDFLTAFGNRGKTWTATPYAFNGKDVKWVDYKVSFFAGFPEIDKEGIEKIPAKDKKIITNRIYGETTGKEKSLKVIVDEAIGEGIEVKVNDTGEDNQKLFSMFNVRTMEEVTNMLRETIITDDEDGAKQEVNIKGTIYYTREPKVVRALDLSNLDQNKENKFRVKVESDSYDKKLSIKKVFPYKDKLYVLLSHMKEAKTHLAWFNKKKAELEGFEGIEGQIKFGNDLTYLHIPNQIVDTTAFYQGKLYFLIKEQDSNQRAVTVDLNDMNSSPEVIGRGVPDDEAIVSLIPLDDKIIFAGEKKFYHLKDTGKTLKPLCDSKCSPLLTRGIKKERIVLYSNRDNVETYIFSVDNPKKQMVIPEGPLFDVYQNGGIIVTTLFHDRLHSCLYQGAHDILSGNNPRGEYSETIPNIKMIKILNERTLAALSYSNNHIKMHLFDPRSLECHVSGYNIDSGAISKVSLE